MGWEVIVTARLLALAFVLLGTAGKPTSEEFLQENSSDILRWPSENGYVVPKTVVSNRMRLVFAVGLEGTGHHMLNSVFSYLFKHNDLPYIEVCPLCQAMYPELVASLSESPLAYAEARAMLVQRMRELATSEQDLEGSPGTIVPLQFHVRTSCSGTGMMSYPNYGGKDKALQYVDLPLMALAAEAEGVDLRLIYLSRSATDVVISTTQHRHFDGGSIHAPEKNFIRYMQILITQATVVLSMLHEVDPGFVVCHRYDSIEEEEIYKVAEFAAPNPEVAEMFAASLKTVAKPVPSKDNDGEDEELAYEAEEIIIMRLQEKLDALNAAFC